MANKQVHPTGEIDLSGEVFQLLYNLCMSETHSDITFLINDTKVPAHKFILSARSSYFQKLFNGDFAEATQTEIALKVPVEAFKAVLGFIYTGRISLVGLNVEQIIEVCDMADQYFFASLKQEISSHLSTILTLDNCVVILNAARLYSLNELESKSWEFMDDNCSDLLIHDAFKAMTQDLMCGLIQRDTFYAPEMDIFNAVRNWYTDHPESDAKMVFSGIRWSVMSSTEVLTVLKSKFLDAERMIEVMNGCNESNHKPRHVASERKTTTSDEYLQDENVASVKHNATVIQCDTNSSALLDVDYATYDFTKGYAISYYNPIIVKLGKEYIINHIQFLLRSDNSREYAYRLEVSLDGSEYRTLFDHTMHFCRSWQNLHFPSRLVRYIRLRYLGARNENLQNGNGLYALQVFGLEAMYRSEQPEFVDGSIKPSSNVATVENGARVIAGVGGNNMFDRNSKEFTCHEIGTGSIILQLNQSYWIDSVGILLGNDRKWNHSNKYSLFIQTSIDNANWSMAVDKRDEQLSSWHRFTFDPRPVVFIKIVGTQQDVNLICSYFECPSFDTIV